MSERAKIKNLSEALRKKSLAVGSGKGGVGKTTTVANLAIYFAKKSLKVVLVDLDPLSDIATILDLEDPESIHFRVEENRAENDLRGIVKKVFTNLDLLTTSTPADRSTGSKRFKEMYARFSEELNRSYDILLFDLPAGIRYEDNIAWLELAGNIVVVTNAEPTAHVSAGEYLKSIVNAKSDIKISMWHNKYPALSDIEFDPRDVIGNYNRNVPKKARISAERRLKIQDLGFIPEDPSLDLLQGNPSIVINVQRSMLDMLAVIREQHISEMLGSRNIKGRILDFVRHFLLNRRRIEIIDDFIDEMAHYLKHLAGNGEPQKRPGIADNKNRGDRQLFSTDQRHMLSMLIKNIKDDHFLQRLLPVEELLEKTIAKQEEFKRPFFTSSSLTPDKALDREISYLLTDINSRLNTHSRTEQVMLRNCGGVLLFYFSVYKLLQSETVVNLIHGFIPVRKNKRGETVRDKLTQISNLVEKNNDYNRRYLLLIKTLFPVLIKQVLTIGRTFELSRLIFRSRANTINKTAYVKLLTNFLHETVNSGLSVIVGFEYRPAALAFREAADALLNSITKHAN